MIRSTVISITKDQSVWNSLELFILRLQHTIFVVISFFDFCEIATLKYSLYDNVFLYVKYISLFHTLWLVQRKIIEIKSKGGALYLVFLA